MTRLSKQIIKLGLLGIFNFISSFHCIAQTQVKKAKYNIEVFGMDVGELNVEQQIIGHDTIVKAITSVDFKFIFTYKGIYSQEGTYRNGELLQSHLKIIRKGKVSSDTRITKTGNYYTVIEGDEDTSYIYNKIRYSGSLVYFNEPVDISTIYYETSGEQKKIEAIGDHIYHVFKINKNKKNDYEYEYEDGILKRATIRYPLANIYLERE
ncbi:MAG: hypothetical protein GXO89_07005 [Chlorobi bacterium]|nr:hypothetical protein [Chlorobiota bacterium]